MRIQIILCLIVGCLQVDAYAKVTVDLLSFEPIHVPIEAEQIELQCINLPKNLKHGLQLTLSKPDMAMQLSMPFLDGSTFHFSKRGTSHLVWMTSDQSSVTFKLSFQHYEYGSELVIESVPILSFVKTIKTPVGPVEVSIMRHSGIPVDALIESGFMKAKGTPSVIVSSYSPE